MADTLFRNSPPGVDERSRAEVQETAAVIDLYHECEIPLEMLGEQAMDRMRDTHHRRRIVRASGR